MAASLSGCFQQKTVIRVNPDGSGTVTETYLFSRALLAEVQGLQLSLAGSPPRTATTFEPFDPVKLKAGAKSLGAGVSYRSGIKQSNADYVGFTAIYDFTDLRKLTLHQKTGAEFLSTKGDGASQHPVTFDFQGGSPASLTVIQPRDAVPATAREGGVSPVSSPLTDTKLIQSLKGMKFEIGIEVNGTIIATNASQRNGNYLTLIELDLDKVIADNPAQLKLGTFSGTALPPRAVLENIPGVKVESNEKMTVLFE